MGRKPFPRLTCQPKAFLLPFEIEQTFVPSLSHVNESPLLYDWAPDALRETELDNELAVADLVSHTL